MSEKKLLDSVITGLEKRNDFKGRWCEHYSEKCKNYLESYGDTNDDCGHNCEYCEKFKWAVNRAKHYEEKLGISWKEILKSWEDDRTSWFMNYYQDAHQPLINSDNVFVFETVGELIEKCGNQFICPNCKGISSDPYECNSGKMIGKKVCDWKSYGLFPSGTCFCYVKEVRKGTRIFIPMALQKGVEHED